MANLQVSGNAMVKASNITTIKDGTGSPPELKPAASGSDGTGGIVWNDKEGTVYGNVTLQEDLEIKSSETIKIPDGSSLNCNGKLTNEGTIFVESGGELEGTPTGNGTLKIAPTITTHPKNVEVKENETATFTMQDKAVTITANWKKKSSGGSVFFWGLKFDTNGGSDIDTVTEWEYSTIDLDEYVPEKEGYKFVGWYADKDFHKKIDEVYLTEDTTVYAKWEKIAEEVPEEPEETEETETISFKDVKESDWFYEAVSYAVENGLMSGMSEDIFAPNTPLTREMLAVILWNLEGNPTPDEVAPFLDVTSDKYYANAIAWANENGIVAGYGNTFGVGDSITREQFAVMLYNYAQYQGYDVSVGEDTNILSYTDAFDISNYAYPAMQWACGAGIMSGNDDGTLNPQGKATRAEAATMLMNFCENVVK